MKWLLWKDYRNNRMVVIAALVFLLAPYLGALIVSCLQVFRWHEDSQVWGEKFAGASVLSLIVSQLSIELIGGNAIAGERADRSAEFQASLPISRKTILCSKLLLALAIVVVIWLTDATTLICLSNRPRGFSPQETMVLLRYTAVTAATLFGIAWFLSSFLASPTFAVAGGLLTPFVLWLSILFVCFMLQLQLDNATFERFAGFLYSTICLTLAPACFAVGTWHYLRRVEP